MGSGCGVEVHMDPEATQHQSDNLLLSATSTDDLSHTAVGDVASPQAEPADSLKLLIDFSNAVDTSQPPERGLSNSVASFKSSLLCADGGDGHRSVMASVEESSGHVPVLVGYSPTAAMDFRRQVNELRASIGAGKRDATVAALIAHVWKPRHKELKALLDAKCQSSPCDEQVYHAKWAEIANQTFLKDKVILELERQMEALGDSGRSSRSRYAEMGELSSKIAAEHAAKMALESKRESLCVGLVKSSPRIQSLVRNALL
ncbi:unnamed protein product [Peronospora belbahrii]|uniref:Uncharacterized protein n=1 Tax=Peronospora belbahrii TaxID=622444 RepID=A0ABN8D6U3_9STRA|nr:unnamed protein product [Peronospora belbahrii]